jgi:hypothetical protein
LRSLAPIGKPLRVSEESTDVRWFLIEALPAQKFDEAVTGLEPRTAALFPGWVLFRVSSGPKYSSERLHSLLCWHEQQFDFVLKSLFPTAISCNK